MDSIQYDFGGFTMPLVNIHLLQGKPVEFRRRLGEVVYKTMVDTINVPEKDNFQIITEYDGNSLIYDPEYLDIQRTDGIVVIQITLNEGRTTERKKEFYKQLAERLHTELGIRTEDVFISLVEVKKENWSFGKGIAQYA
jgi:phenylpyruvate tautomerase PptA (4-oxalocrotonate tautomerase family)